MVITFQDTKSYIIALVELLIDDKITEDEFWYLVESLYTDTELIKMDGRNFKPKK